MKKFISILVLMVVAVASLVANAQTVAYITKNSTGNVWAWDDGGNYFQAWPGVAISSLPTTTVNGTEYYYVIYDHSNNGKPYIIFNDGNGQAQTSDIAVVDKRIYNYTGGGNGGVTTDDSLVGYTQPYASVYIDKASVGGYIYAYDQVNGTATNYGEWVGQSIQSLATATKDGVEYYVFEFNHENATEPVVIFNNGNGGEGNQTMNIHVADGDILKYLGGNSYVHNGTTYPQNKLYLMGVDNWEDGVEMTLGEDGKFTITKEMEANAEFKFRDDANWYGPVSEGNFIVTQEQVENGTSLTLTTESGMNNFLIPVAGTWTLTVDKANMNVVISGTWPEPEPYATIYIDKASVEGNIYAYDQVDGTAADYGEWVGQSIQSLATATKDGVEYYVFEFNHENATDPVVIFNDGEGNQTVNIHVADGDILKYLGGNSYVHNGTTYPQNKLYLMGLGDWENGVEMTLGEDGKFTITKEMEANAEFKFKDDANWYGPVSEGNFIVTQDQVENGTSLTLTTESGMNNFLMPMAGTWTLIVDKANMSLVIKAVKGIRGDVDQNGNVNIADVTTLIDYLLSNDATNINLVAADCDLDTVVNIADVTVLIDYLLSGNW